MTVFSMLIPLFFCFVLVYAQFSNIKVFESFKNGVAEGFDTVKTIFPSLLLIMTAIGVFKASGAMDILIFCLEPISRFTGFPSEVIPVAVLKPFSGSGASAMMESVVKKYGADSFLGKLSAVICASTETTFYTASVYLSGLKGNFGKVIVCALITDIFSFAISFIVVKILM
ncbi:MAG: spore maturation protein [Clostridia bacterium]|nr:spore maturation protein [Clostridia bacterium]